MTEIDLNDPMAVGTLTGWSQIHPDKPAVITVWDDKSITFAELESQANRVAQLFRKLGLKRGDTAATLVGNSIEFLEINNGAQRSGLYLVPIASRLNAEEAAYIINDSQSRVAIIDAGTKHGAELAASFAAMCPGVEHVYAVRGDLPGPRKHPPARCATRDTAPVPAASPFAPGPDHPFESQREHATGPDCCIQI